MPEPFDVSQLGASLEGEEQEQDYTPFEDEQKIISEINRKFDNWRSQRQPHDSQWYVNGANMRGQQYVEWNVRDSRLSVPPAPPHRIRIALNRIRPKIEARRAKFIRHRTNIEVAPASSEQQDRLNARATKKVIDYIWRAGRLEEKKRQAILWSEICGKGFWWIYWDADVMGQVTIPGPDGQPIPQDAVLGDVRVETGSAFEVLVADPTVPNISNQPEIMRVKIRSVEEAKGRYQDFSPFIKADTSSDEVFRFEKQLGTLNTSGHGGAGMLEGRSNTDEQRDLVVVKEHFVAPTGKHPKGKYRVLVGNVLVRNEEELPFGFHDMGNPFPVVEFIDTFSPTQFWGTTLIEQLIPLQREYNLARSKLAEHIRASVHPKLIVYKQHRLPKGSWTSEAGEVIELAFAPSVPPPIVVTPPSIAGDAWRTLELIRSEFEDISQVFPAAEGARGGATSGFQTNLLQEATEAVHAPNLQALDEAVEDAAFKIRRLVKRGYQFPRLINALGRSLEPEVLEFVGSQVDEHADIKVEGASALPSLKATRLSMVQEMFTSGLLGPPDDPETRRRTLNLMELGGPDQALDDARIDEDQARLENIGVSEGNPIPPPEYHENHPVHWKAHAAQLKSPESRSWPPEVRQELIAHNLLHLDFIDPLAAFEAANSYGLPPPPRALQAMQQQQIAAEQGIDLGVQEQGA